MLDAFYRRSPEKTDVYQHRDVGFIAESLSHLFVTKMKNKGYRVAEAELIELNSVYWEPEDECDTGDFDEVWSACDRLYRNRQITLCQRVLGAAVRKGGLKDKRLRELNDVLITGIREGMELPQTMHEYLPDELRTDLNTLISTYNGFRKILLIYLSKRDEESRALLSEYMRLTHFSKVVARCIEEQNTDIA